MGKDYTCRSCGYLWTSRKRIGYPSKCPNCNSRNISSVEEIENYNKMNHRINKEGYSGWSDDKKKKWRKSLGLDRE